MGRLRKITMYPSSFREKFYIKNISIKQACAIYYPRMLWNGRRNSPKAVQEYLESIEVELFCQELASYSRKCVSNSGEKLRPTLPTKTTVVFHQVSYSIAFYNQSIEYTIHWLLFRTWKKKSRIGYKNRLIYYFLIN